MAFTTYKGTKAANTHAAAGATQELQYGYASNDTLTGGAQVGEVQGDKIYGGDGNDSMSGLGGKDTIYGGNGADIALGGANADFIDGGLGNDSLDGGLGNDRVFGGYGNDTMIGDAGNDTLRGGANNDSMIGGTSGGATEVDYSYGDAGNDIMIGTAGNATYMDGGIGNDSITGGTGNDTVIGGAGADTLAGGAGTDTLSFSSLGKDTILSTATNKVGITLNLTAGTMTHSSGDDVLTGGGFEAVIGTLYNDSMLGSTGAETINGGAGNDTIAGAAGSDSLLGGTGNDTFLSIDGGGNDTINGGTQSTSTSGNYDTADYSLVTTAVTVDLSNGTASYTGVTQSLTGIEKVIGTGVADTLTAIGSGYVDGGAGDDTIYSATSGAGKSYLVGGAGADVYQAEGSSSSDRFGVQSSGGTDSIVGFTQSFDKVFADLSSHFGITVTATNAVSGAVVDNGLYVATYKTVANTGGTFDLLSVALADDAIVNGTSATQAHAQFLFDAATGNLVYDSNGTTAAGTTTVATFDIANMTASVTGITGLAIDSGDFELQA